VHELRRWPVLDLSVHDVRSLPIGSVLSEGRRHLLQVHVRERQRLCRLACDERDERL